MIYTMSAFSHTFTAAFVFSHLLQTINKDEQPVGDIAHRFSQRVVLKLSETFVHFGCRFLKLVLVV